MTYVGIYSQQRNNNIKSILLLIGFPCIILGMVWVFYAVLDYLGAKGYDSYGNPVQYVDTDAVAYQFLQTLPWVVGIVGIWFCIAYFMNTSMVRRATGARPLERSENPRVYNIVENLCMTCDMDMPKINVIDDPQLNAFASGIDKSSYTVTVTTGIMDFLDDDELAGVIGHELTHIRNNDTRLLITSIVFVGIVSTVMSIIMRMLLNSMIYGGGERSRNSKEKGGGIFLVLIVALVCSAIAYLFVLLTRFAISRKREYMADAGGAELSGKPWALASALRKISGDPALQNIEREDVAQLFIIHQQSLSSGVTSFISSMFSTHPDTAKRIKILEQF